jgi:membrane-bound serine protease (ClpP class)
MDTDVQGYAIAWPLITAVTALSAVFLIGVVFAALKSRRRRIVSGREGMLGTVGEAMEDFKDTGRVRVHSEDWQARSAAPVARGQKVKILAIDGLTLTVEPYHSEDD